MCERTLIFSFAFCAWTDVTVAVKDKSAVKRIEVNCIVFGSNQWRTTWSGCSGSPSQFRMGLYTSDRHEDQSGSKWAVSIYLIVISWIPHVHEEAKTRWILADSGGRVRYSVFTPEAIDGTRNSENWPWKVQASKQTSKQTGPNAQRTVVETTSRTAEGC